MSAAKMPAEAPASLPDVLPPARMLNEVYDRIPSATEKKPRNGFLGIGLRRR